MWNRAETDCIVIGSGIAGLTLSLLASKHARVTLVTKSTLETCNSSLAQGGIAAALSAEDAPFLHREDTLGTGQGLCVNQTVEAYVEHAPEAIRFLQQIGVNFDAAANGSLLLGKEGAHSRNRIVHAGGDATGRIIMDTLLALVKDSRQITIWENTLVSDLIRDNDECKGVVGIDRSGTPFLLSAKSVVLATGGLGQLFQYTTNAPGSTGDGYSLAYRANAIVRDMEFIQFHPTALRTDACPLPLVSEAVRGEGAVLINSSGYSFMRDYDERGDLASRDVVSQSIYTEMQAGRAVFLDARSVPNFQQRFPTIYKYCRQMGLDPQHEFIPVVPAVHYMMGGIQTNGSGKTSVRRLFAIGEAASSGFHGANRLASNSLLEGVVMAQRTVHEIAGLSAGSAKPLEVPFSYDDFVKNNTFSDNTLLNRIQKLMWKHVGIVREKHGLREALHQIAALLDQEPELPTPNRHLLTTAYLVVNAALWRRESRGAHFRRDYPEASPLFQTHSMQGGTYESVTHTSVSRAGTY